MAKLEKILDEYSWLFKLGIIGLWLLWALQTGAGLGSEWEKEKEHQKNRNIEIEIKINGLLYQYGEKLYQEALAKKEHYSPYDYFHDLRLVHMKNHELESKFNQKSTMRIMQIDWMNNLSFQNVRANNFSDYDIKVARENFKEAMLKDDPCEMYKDPKNTNWSIDGPKILNWFIVLYFRSLLLVLIYYLIRMSERNGILETILAGKRKFIFAIIAWPIMFSRYPFNVVREIVVAVELRRFGNLFRRFTKEEKEDVRNIAEREDYRTVIRDQYEYAFVRSFWIALLPALMLYLFIPVADASVEKLKKARGDTTISVEQVVQQDFAKSHPDNTQTPHFFDYISECVIAILILKEFVRFVVSGWLDSSQILPNEIDCIPNFGCEVGEVFLQTN